MTETREHDQRGFTLLEILVVIAILGLLVGLVAPAALRQLGFARVSVAKQSIERIGSGVGGNISQRSAAPAGSAARASISNQRRAHFLPRANFRSAIRFSNKAGPSPSPRSPP